jgi:Ca2+-binding EF-hand superfamily protein
MAFKSFDTDGNGFISVRELKETFQGVSDFTGQSEEKLWT